METGAPALVLQRTGRQADDVPLADWQVRVTSSVTPAYLALEVESAPESGDPLDVAGELVFMLEDAANAADATINRPETMAHLRARRMGTLPWAPQALRAERRWRRPALAAGFAAFVAAAVLHLGGATSPGLPAHADAGAEFADAGWGGSEAVTGLVLTSTTDSEPFLLARALPKKPFENQKRPPCKVKEKLEVEINGGCWVPHKEPAPCPDELYEFRGSCFLPAAKPEKSPTALSRQPLAFDRP